MITRSWISRLFARTPRRPTVRTPFSRRYRGFRPSIDLLEDRTLLSLTIVPASQQPLHGTVVAASSIVAGDLNGNGVTELVDADIYGFNHGNVPASVDVWTPSRGVFSQHGDPDRQPNNLPGDPSLGFFNVALGDFDGRHSVTGLPILDIAVVGDRGLSVFMNNGHGFGSPISYGSQTTFANHLAVGDFTGNGNTDLLVTGLSAPWVMLGNGHGSFQNPQGISTDTTFAGMAVVGDFDGRHYANGLPILDVAVIPLDSSGHSLPAINVYMNRGQSTLAFNAPVSYAVGQNPSSIAVGDFRGDGTLDLAVANTNSNNVSVLLGHGDGTFQPAVNYAVGVSPKSIGVGDFNGDGKLDIAVASGSNGTVSVSVLLGTGQGNFLRAQVVETFNGVLSNLGSSMAVGDFVGAGYSGLAVADYVTGTIHPFQSFGMSSLFQPAHPLGVGGVGGVAVGDFTGDGKADVALTAAVGGINVLPGNGDGTFSSPINSCSGVSRGFKALAVGDFNGDGKLGLAWTPDQLNFDVLPGNGDGTFHPSFHLFNGDDIFYVAVGDFNGDGKLDLAVSAHGDIQIYLANGDGTFGILNHGSYDPNHIYPGAGGYLFTGIAVGDFNGDGKLDLEVPGHALLLGNGDGSFQSPVSDGVVGDLVAVADLDGRRYANGQPIVDLVTITFDPLHDSMTRVNVYLGNGDGTFQEHVSYPSPAAEVSSLAVGDFNGDGKPDIAVQGHSANASFVNVLLGNGDGTFQAPFADIADPDVTIDEGGGQIAAGDFTGDGRSGIVTDVGELLLPAAPDFSLSGASVAEHQPAGTLVGTFNTPSDDPNESFTYRLVSGTGGADNADFTIDATGHLKTAATFDYWTSSSYSIRVRSTDVVGAISERVFTIRITPGATQFGVVPSVQAVLPGTPFSITVTTLDAAGRPAAYLGPVHFSSTDPQATLPADYTFTAADHGTHTFTGVVFHSTGRQTLTASNGGLGSVTEVTIPTGSSLPEQITTGPDGNLWFTELTGNKIGKLSPSGTVTEFPIPTSNSHLYGITVGRDGNLWFTESSGNKIGRITPAGVVTEWTIGTANSAPEGITAGPDGNLWFVESAGNKVGRVTTLGSLTDYPIPTANSGPAGIAVGPDGNLWFTEQNGNRIGRIGVSGTITEFAVPTPTSLPSGITAGADGNLWFTEYTGNKVARITPFGTVTEYPVPTGNSSPRGITAGPDGNLWFTEFLGNKVGRITPAGSVTEYPVPANSRPFGITTGPDGNLWFVEYLGNRVGRMTSAALTGSARVDVPGPATQFAVSAPAGATAGTPFSVTVTAQDNNGLTAINYTGTVHFTSSDAQATLPADYTFTAADNGVHTFSGVILRTAHFPMPTPITATDTVTGSITGSAGVRVTAAAATHFGLSTSAANPDIAGTPFDVTVTAQDPYGNTDTGYLGMVHFTSADPYGANLPADFQFRNVDQGVHRFPAGATLYTAGTWDVTATDTTSGITGTANVNVIAAPASQLGVATDAANPDIAGTVFDVTVVATDPYGNTDTNYRGTVHFTSGDPYGASLPADYTFQASDQGVATLAGVTALYTAGTWDVTATDTQRGMSGAAFVNVQAAPAVALQVVALASVASGTPFDVTVSAVDPYGNTDAHYAGTVTFSTSDGDPGVVVPPDYAFQASDQGMVTFSGGVTLITPGDQTLTATDTLSGITGTATVTVTSGAAPGVGGFGFKATVSQQPASATVATGTASRSAVSADQESYPVRTESVAATAHRAVVIDQVWSDPANPLFTEPWTDGLELAARS